jgi:hypothetical protein
MVTAPADTLMYHTSRVMHHASCIIYPIVLHAACAFAMLVLPNV